MGTIKIKDAEGNWVGLPNYGIQQFPDAPTDGKQYARQNATWSEVEKGLVLTNITAATSLTNLPIDKYSIKVTLTTASTLSFNTTPTEGWECSIIIFNNSATAITQNIPSDDSWITVAKSINIPSYKYAEIKVKYIFGKYIVSTNVFVDPNVVTVKLTTPADMRVYKDSAYTNLYNDTNLDIKKGTILYIKWVGIGYGDANLPKESLATPRAAESYNYLYFKPEDGSAVQELQFSGVGYDVSEYQFTVQQGGELYIVSL